MSYAPPPKVRPSAAMYLVPALVWILFSIGACGGGGYKIFTGVTDEVDNLESVSAATGGTIDIDEGHYYVYYSDGSSSSTTTTDPGIDFTITDPAGNDVAIDRSPETDITFDTSEDSGVGVAEFDARSNGTYTVTITSEPSVAGAGRILIGPNVLEGAKEGLAIMVIAGSAGFIIALIIVIIIARKRGKSKRENQMGYGGGSWPGGGQTYPAQGGYGAPASYPPAGSSYPPSGGYQQPPSGGGYQPPPPPPGGGFPPSGGGYQPPPGGFPPSGS